jgi:hypothetical protein
MSSVSYQVPVGQRQLFLDDVGIAACDGLTRNMHQPRKLGAVIRPDPSVGISSHQTRTAPVWEPEEQVFKFLILGHPDDMTVNACSYFESRDGLHWTKPSLNQVEYHGSADNNYLLVNTGTHQLAPQHFVRDPEDPDPARRYKGASLFHRRIDGQIDEPGVGFFVSPDARIWAALYCPRVRSSDEHNMSYDPILNQFILTVKQRGTQGGRAVWLSTSQDFEHWTEPELIFEADEQDQELGKQNIRDRLSDSSLHQPLYNDAEAHKVDVYNMGVFRYEGLYIGMPAMYHAVGNVPNYPNTDGFHLVQLACSRDLKNWRRLGDREAFIGPSPLGAGAYDLTQILCPSNAVIGGDEMWFYYTGIKYRAHWKYVGEYPNGEHVQLPGFDPDIGAICLAVLRRDGFISLDADDGGGTLKTEPFVLTGSDLFINVDTSRGKCRIEVLDVNDTIVAESTPLKGDLLQGKVNWQQGGLTSLQGKIVSLLFTLYNAEFYSYWF